jgi:hypothetical protein
MSLEQEQEQFVQANLFGKAVSSGLLGEGQVMVYYCQVCWRDLGSEIGLLSYLGSFRTLD